MFDGRWRDGVDRVTTPVAATMRRTGITADHLTTAGIALGLVTAVVIGSGHLIWGLLLLILAASLDLFDGPVAKAAGMSGPRGAFFDSVSDRVTDALVLGGIAWYLASEHGAHAALLPFAVLGASSIISYERAKAESLGYVAKGGLMERAERIIAICLGLLVSALLVPILWVTLALTVFTAVQRFFKVWRQAPPPAPRRRPPMEERWRAWREASSRRGPRPRRHDRPRREGRREHRWRKAPTQP
ncbi:MAG TPA: CDP-alcohol phosphatidyltransferase family protein [Acidimicrobiales bacterium]|nr:CDP-alcohol phosphatidyltransferase family protein [Acidimicrobiales bacterium]